MDRGRFYLYAGLGGLAAAVFAYAAYLRQALAISAGFDAAAVVAAGSLLGFAAGAAFAAILGPRAGRNPASAFGVNALLFGLTAFVVGAALGHLTLDAAGSSAGWSWLVYLIYLLAGALPGRFAGYAFGVAFRLRADEANRVYAAFLGGGAAGALLVAAAFDLLGGAGALALVAVLAAGAAVLFYLGTSKAKLVAPAVLALAAIILPLAAPFLFGLAPTRALFLGASGNAVSRTEWSAASRAELSSPAEGAGKAAAALAAVGGDVVTVLPAHEWLTVGGRAASPVLKSDAAADLLRNYAPAFACRLKTPDAALVIGGGGFDAATMATLCAGRVDVVVDDAACEVLRSSGYAADLVDAGRVSFRRGDGRAFLRGRSDTYDLIYLSPTVVPVPGEAAPTLAPDYRLTVDAFREYYRHLSPEGIMAVAAREGKAPGYTHKLAATVYRALRAEGELRPASGIVIFERGGVVVIFATPGGFERLEVEGLAGIAGEEFEPRYLPGRVPTPGDAGETYSTLLTVDAPAGDYGRYDNDVAPVGDDRPFPARLAKGAGLSLSPDNVGGALGLGTCAITILAAVGFLLVSLIFFRRQKVRMGGKAGFGLYFLLVGAVFAVLAVSLKAKVAFYLGGGSWAGPAATAMLLGVAAAGSVLSGKIARRRRWLPFLLAAAAALLYLSAYDAVFAATAGWTWLVRFYAAVVLVALVGFFLGTLAPVGLATAAGRGPSMLPWVWAAYIFAYVFGDVGALLLASAAGFRLTVGAAFLLLVGAGGAFAWASRSHLPPVTAEVEERP
ncbi:MAG TPA: hypothetical protein VMW93_02405 [bacterium]|nr:hypothetical protein [bacterium]